MERILNNLYRLPGRLARGWRQWRDPVYRLQREANRAVSGWLGQARMRALDAIPGTSSFRESRLLAHLAVQAPGGGCIVEIGAYKGKSAAWLVEASEHRSDPLPVISIDPHEDHNDYDDPRKSTWSTFMNTVAEFKLRERGLEILRARSHDVGIGWNRSISFLWIDGSHEYQAVCDDIEDFAPHVVSGGWLVFDDAQGGYFPGVERALAEHMLGRPGFRHVGAIKHFELFQKD